MPDRLFTPLPSKTTEHLQGENVRCSHQNMSHHLHHITVDHENQQSTYEYKRIVHLPNNKALQSE